MSEYVVVHVVWALVVVVSIWRLCRTVERVNQVAPASLSITPKSVFPFMR